MCETGVLNRSIVGLSKRSFSRRLSLVSGSCEVEKGALSRLNTQLDKFYDTLYDAYPSITKEDYDIFGPYLQILLSTLEDLIKAYRKSNFAMLLNSGIDRLSRNYSAIYELNSDIINFKINLPNNPRLNTALSKLKAI